MPYANPKIASTSSRDNAGEEILAALQLKKTSKSEIAAPRTRARNDVGKGFRSVHFQHNRRVQVNEKQSRISGQVSLSTSLRTPRCYLFSSPTPITSTTSPTVFLFFSPAQLFPRLCGLLQLSAQQYQWDILRCQREVFACRSLLAVFLD